MDRQWNFEAHSSEDRDEWVAHIDQAIITRLQLLESSRRAGAGGSVGAGGSPLVPSSSANEGSAGLNSWGHGAGGSDPGGVKNGSDKPDSIRVDEAMAKSLRSVAGNDACADCGAPGKCTFAFTWYFVRRQACMPAHSSRPNALALGRTTTTNPPALLYRSMRVN